MPSKIPTGGSELQDAPFRVIVVGAGVAGLVASHCLHKAGIEHVVLERQTDVAPPLGTSIAMYPSSARILHQIGCLEAMEASCVPCKRYTQNGPDGKPIASSLFFDYVKQNHGQDVLLHERRQFLQNLYDCLPDKKRIRLGCEVKTIKQDDIGVEVILTDGTVEKGDMVLGTDGVRSLVRSLMWEHANKTTPGLITVKEKTCMKVRWKLLTGISPPAPELGDRDMIVCHDTNFSILTLTQPDHTYWFVFFKLEKEFSWPKEQRYTAQDAEVAAASVADHPVSNSIVFGEIWKKRERAVLINVEEGVLDHWYEGRIVLAGDCVHKMTPNIALGGNTAIESIAVLCNQLHSMLVSQQGARPSRATLNKAFATYQAERRPRVVEIVNFSSDVTKMQAWATPFHKFYNNWVLPLQSEQTITNMIAEIVRVAPKLEYVDTGRFRGGRVAWKDDTEDKKYGEKNGKWSLQWWTSAMVLMILAFGVAQYGRVLSLLRFK